MDRVISIAERIFGTAILLVTALFSLVVMTGLFVPSREWEVFSDAKKAQTIFQCSMWMLFFLSFDFATPGRTLFAILKCDGPLASPDDKRNAALLYSAIAISLAYLIGGSAFR